MKEPTNSIVQESSEVHTELSRAAKKLHLTSFLLKRLELLLVEMNICAGATGGKNELLPPIMLPPLLKPAVLDVMELPGVWVGFWKLNAPTK